MSRVHVLKGQGTACVNAGDAAMLLQTYKLPKTSRCGMRGALRKHLEGAFSTWRNLLLTH